MNLSKFLFSNKTLAKNISDWKRRFKFSTAGDELFVKIPLLTQDRVEVSYGYFDDKASIELVDKKTIYTLTAAYIDKKGNVEVFVNPSFKARTKIFEFGNPMQEIEWK